MGECMRKKIGVVADDVTGANDIGIMFRKGGYRSAVFPQGLLQFCDLKAEAEKLDVIIMDTDSRFDAPEQAKEKVRQATELLMTLPCDMYYNKTCSVFRGNIGAEFDEMQDVLGVDCSMVVLGFPANGRTTLDGIHYVYGEKLEDSQFRNDPIHPMTTSSLEEILHKQSKRRVSHINWKDLDQGLKYVRTKKEVLKKECAYLVFDIRDQADMRLVARVVSDEKNICGSSAIGEELPGAYETEGCAMEICAEENRRQMEVCVKENDSQLGNGTEASEQSEFCMTDDCVLLLAGSLTSQSCAQVAYLKEHGYPFYEFDADCIYREEKRANIVEELTEAVLHALREQKSCLLYSSNRAEAVEQTKKYGKSLGLTDEEIGKRISGTMCRIIRTVLEESGCRSLVVAGGDTSAAVTAELKIFKMNIGAEIEPGVPAMTAATDIGPMKLVLKSGSFGSEAFLEKAMNTLRGRSQC